MKILGRVAEGSKIGRQIGYPTANINIDNGAETQNGVYAAIVKYNGRRYGAMANLGVKPTFSDGKKRVLELHLLDFEGDLYGHQLETELLKFIRPERKFASQEELRTQIEIDKQTIVKILNELKCI